GARLGIIAGFVQVLIVSIHAPRTGRDKQKYRSRSTVAVSIHAPRTGRDPAPLTLFATVAVSIHAPRTGRDMNYAAPCGDFTRFQSTRPVRGATSVRDKPCPPLHCFNPRAPYGA